MSMEILHRFDLDPAETLAWVREVVGEPQQLPRVLNDKGWSIVLHLGSVVLKVTSAGTFPDGARMFELVGRAAPGSTPELLAWRVAENGQQEMLFRPFGGVPIDTLPLVDKPAALVRMAQTTARIQKQVSHLAPTGLTAVRATDVPAMFDELLEGAVCCCESEYADRWAVECTRQEISEGLATALRPWRSAIADWAAELEDSSGSRSIDHVDLLPHNTNLLPNGECVVYDWEQATLGVPFFSVDILLAYAQCVDMGWDGLHLLPEQETRTQVRMREAYLAELPGSLELALRLAPIRYCWSEWRQAVAAKVPHYGVDDVAWWLGRALRRWERAGHL